MLSATIPVPATVKSLVTKLLVNLGDPAAERGTTESRTLRLSTLLKNCSVELIILDEFQHFIDRDSQRVLQNVSDWLKNLLNETSIPIVLVGMPHADLVLEVNPQLRRRFSARESLEPFGWEPVARRDDFRRFLKVLESKLPFARSSHLADHSMALRFYAATDGVVANVMKLARRAAVLAVEGALDELTLPILAQAYEECLASNNRGKSNPFAAEVDSLHVQTNFYNFLDWRRVQPNVVHTKVGVRRDFGGFEITLYKTLTSARFDFIRTAFEQYLVTRWDGGYLPQRCRRFTEADQMERKYVSRIQAGRLLGIAYTKIEGLIKNGTLRGIIRNSGRRKIYLVEPASIRAFKLETEQRLSFRATTRVLGIHPGSLLGLVAHGCLVPVKRPTTGDRRWAFTRHSINDLLCQMTDKVSPAGESLPADIYSFKEAAQKLRFLRINLGQFVRLILDGAVRPCGTSAEHGLAQFNFSSGALAAFIRARLTSPVAGPFSIRETATMLGLSMGAAYTLIKKGLLCAQQSDTKSHRLKVTAASVTDFASAYVSTRELSDRYDVAARLLIRVLSAHGVRPTSGPQLDGVPVHLYRRTVLAHLDLAALLARERHQINPIDKRGSLLNAAQVAEVLGINQEAVGTLVRGEELKPYGRVPEDHEDKLLFTRHEVDHYRHRGIDRAELLTDVQAAQMLDEDPTWFYKRWVHTRRVSTVELVGSRGAYYFLKQDIAALIEFKEKFITMTEAADMLGWNRATVHLWTQKGKLNPVSGPGIDNAGYYLYLKDDIENLRHARVPVDEQR